MEKPRHESIVLSSTEAESIGVSEVVRELQFIIQLLQTMNIYVQLPIKVNVDNIGTIWLANNNSSSERTRHIDIRAHFIKGFVLEGVIHIVFVMSANSDSNLFTKKILSMTHTHHSKKLIWTIDEMNQV